MKNVIIVVLLVIIAYLLYTSGILSRAVQSQPNPSTVKIPSATPQIVVTVYSPFGTGTQTPASQPEDTQSAPFVPSVTLVPTASPTPIPAIGASSATLPPPTIILPAVPPTLAVANTPTPSTNFTVTLEAPRDGETTNASPVLVTGFTTPGAVVSANDVVGIANAQGHFALTVPLQSGPNVLEVIASKPDGEQTFVIVTVLYRP